MDKWNETIDINSIRTLKNTRAALFIAQKIKKSDELKYVDAGWERAKVYSNPAYVLMKKEKNEEEQFVDKVWCLFASMGFSEINVNNEIFVPYGDDEKDSFPFSVMAVDEESAIFVVIKYFYGKEESRLINYLESFQSHVREIRKNILAVYPKRKIKFCMATHNLVMSKYDLEKMSNLDIIHFDESAISYYSDLVKHIGTASKYQLLGNLFAKQEIMNMDNRIPAIQGKMGGYTYYSFSIEPEKLLKIGYVLHRNEANAAMMPTYQRIIKKGRLKQVREFVDNGGYFPNSIIITIDTDGKALQFDPSNLKVEGSISRIGILHLPKKYHSAYIIDGQHRLYGYSGSKYATTNTVPVVAFVNLGRSEQIKLFMDINENQKAVPKTLRVTLNADMLWDSEDKNEQRQALRSKIAQKLGEDSTSPLKGRIIIGENEQSAFRAVSIEAIQKGLAKSSFFSKYGKKNVLEKEGTFDTGNIESTCDRFYPLLENYMLFFMRECPEEWECVNEHAILVINRGIYALIRILDDLVNMLMERAMIIPEEQSVEEIMDLLSLYLNPLAQFINSMRDDERDELKGYLGEGGYTRFWRVFQKAIKESKKDFKPEGFEDFWKDQSKTYNNDTKEYIDAILNKAKSIIKSCLSNEFGEDWMEKGLPKSVYRVAKENADNEIYERKKNDEDIDDISPWNYINLSDCREIVLSGKNWSTIFSDKMVLPKEKDLPGDKDSKTLWMKNVEEIRRRLAQKNYSVTQSEFTFVSSVFEWIRDVAVFDF